MKLIDAIELKAKGKELRWNLDSILNLENSNLDYLLEQECKICGDGEKVYFMDVNDSIIVTTL